MNSEHRLVASFELIQSRQPIDPDRYKNQSRGHQCRFHEAHPHHSLARINILDTHTGANVQFVIHQKEWVKFF
jgi:hypothetical protein